MNQDFLDLLRALSAAEARFLIVGAHAVSYHAEPRTTGDLDIWVEASLENAPRVYKALESFGAPLSDLAPDELAHGDLVFQLGVPPRRIDILTSISGVSFQQAWPERVAASIGDVQFHIIGAKHLLHNKRAAGRPKDLIDVLTLEKHQRS